MVVITTESHEPVILKKTDALPMDITFDPSSHSQFVTLSGDRNPIHTDAIAARRTSTGVPIVHGIHSLLRLIESMIQLGTCAESGRLKVRFNKPIYIHDTAQAEVRKSTERLTHARLLVDRSPTIVASISLDERPSTATSVTYQGGEADLLIPTVPNDLNFDDIRSCKGQLSFDSITNQVETMFPTAAHHFGTQQISALICCSRLVGMVVPGLHSLFTGLDILLSRDSGSTNNSLHFAVTTVDSRFRLVGIEVLGGGISGSLETVSRLPPVKQPSMESLTSFVRRDEFRNSSALIVGGSRGLGELTGKLVAAGGGKVTITYAKGESDARAVVDEITKTGMLCQMRHYDVHGSALGQLAEIEPPTHLYYFATPPIFRRKSGLCDQKRLAELNSFYITAFLDVVEACLHRSRGDIRVFYPSSIAVETRPSDMTEYAMVKAAGEILCADMQQYLSRAHVITRRLPRLPTDQTNSLIQAETEDPVAVLLPIVREMHSSTI